LTIFNTLLSSKLYRGNDKHILFQHVLGQECVTSWSCWVNHAEGWQKFQGEWAES